MDLDFNNSEEFVDLILMKLKNPQSASSLIDMLNRSRYAEKINDEVKSDEEGWVLFGVSNVFGNMASSVNLSIGYFRNFRTDINSTIYVADRWYQNSRNSNCEFFKDIYTSSFLNKGMNREPDNSFSKGLKKLISYNSDTAKKKYNPLYGFGGEITISIEDDLKKKIASCRISAHPKMFKDTMDIPLLQEIQINQGFSLKDAIKLNANNSFEAVIEEENIVGYFFGKRFIDYNFSQSTIIESGITYDKLDITYEFNDLTKKTVMYFDTSSFLQNEAI